MVFGQRGLLAPQVLLLDQFKVSFERNLNALLELTLILDPIGSGINCRHNSRWTSSRTYKNGSKVVYKGSVYIASSLNLVSFI